MSRENELILALKNFGVFTVYDEGLYEKYTKDYNLDIKFVVKRLCEMKYLVEYCGVDKNLIVYHDNYTDYREFEKEASKALQLTGGYPDYWPWLSEYVER